MAPMLTEMTSEYRMDVEPLANRVADRGAPIPLRLASLHFMKDNCLRQFTGGEFPDLLRPFKIFNDVASDPAEDLQLRCAAVAWGTQGLVRATADFYKAAKTLRVPPRFSPEGVALMREKVAAALQSNLGDPDNLLGNLLTLAAGDAQPWNLREQALQAYGAIRADFETIGNGYTETGIMKAGLLHLAQSARSPSLKARAQAMVHDHA